MFHHFVMPQSGDTKVRKWCFFTSPVCGLGLATVFCCHCSTLVYLHMDPEKTAASLWLLENENKRKKEWKSLACFVTPLFSWPLLDRYNSAAAPSVDIIKRRPWWIMRCVESRCLRVRSESRTRRVRVSTVGTRNSDDSDCWQRRRLHTHTPPLTSNPRRYIWHHKHVCSHTHSMQILSSGGWVCGGKGVLLWLLHVSLSSASLFFKQILTFY